MKKCDRYNTSDNITGRGCSTKRNSYKPCETHSYGLTTVAKSIFNFLTYPWCYIQICSSQQDKNTWNDKFLFNIKATIGAPIGCPKKVINKKITTKIGCCWAKFFHRHDLGALDPV